MRVSYEEQLRKLEEKRAALQRRLAEQQAKSVVLTGDEPDLQPTVAALREACEKMQLPEKNVLEGLAKAVMRPVMCTFRKPRGSKTVKAKRSPRAKAPKK